MAVGVHHILLMKYVVGGYEVLDLNYVNYYFRECCNSSVQKTDLSFRTNNQTGKRVIASPRNKEEIGMRDYTLHLFVSC